VFHQGGEGPHAMTSLSFPSPRPIFLPPYFSASSPGSGAEGGEGGLHLGEFRLPVGEALAVFVEDFGGDFLREVRVRKFVGDLGDFGGDAFLFLGEAESFGGAVDEAGEGQEEFAEGVGRAGRAFGRRVVAGDFDGLGVEEDFEDFDFSGGQVAGGAEDELQFFRRVELGVAAEVAAEGDEFVFGGGDFFRGVVEAEVFLFLVY
jgi:hypothetical protein